LNQCYFSVNNAYPRGVVHIIYVILILWFIINCDTPSLYLC